MQPGLNNPELELRLGGISRISRPFAIAGVGLAAIAGGYEGNIGETNAYAQTNSPAQDFHLEPRPALGLSGGQLCAESALADSKVDARYIFKDRLISFSDRALAKEIRSTYPKAKVNLSRKLRTDDLYLSIDDPRPNLGENEKTCANYGKRIIRFWQRIENDEGRMELNSPVVEIIPDDEAIPQNIGSDRFHEEGRLSTFVGYTCQPGKNEVRKWDIVGQKTWRPINGAPQVSRKITHAWRSDKRAC